MEDYLDFESIEAMLSDLKGKRTEDLIAPNGKRSNLSSVLYDVVRTESFKKWFGDWENDPKHASVVVDSNGEPKVVYHGTDYDFDEFTNENSNGDIGYFFTDKEGIAKSYITKDNGKTLACFLNIRKPYEVDAEGYDWNEAEAVGAYGIVTDTGNFLTDWQGERYEFPRMQSALQFLMYGEYPRTYTVKPIGNVAIRSTRDIANDKLKGSSYDGVIIRNVVDLGKGSAPITYSNASTVYVAKKSNQVKSINNKGSFGNTGKIYETVQYKDLNYFVGSSNDTISYGEVCDICKSAESLRAYISEHKEEYQGYRELLWDEVDMYLFPDDYDFDEEDSNDDFIKGKIESTIRKVLAQGRTECNLYRVVLLESPNDDFNERHPGTCWAYSLDGINDVIENEIAAYIEDGSTIVFLEGTTDRENIDWIGSIIMNTSFGECELRVIDDTQVDISETKFIDGKELIDTYQGDIEEALFT